VYLLRQIVLVLIRELSNPQLQVLRTTRRYKMRIGIVEQQNELEYKYKKSSL